MINATIKTISHLKDYGIGVPVGFLTLAASFKIADVVIWLQAVSLIMVIISAAVTTYLKLKNDK